MQPWYPSENLWGRARAGPTRQDQLVPQKTVLEKINYRFVQPAVVWTGIHSVDAGTKSACSQKKLWGRDPAGPTRQDQLVRQTKFVCCRVRAGPKKAGSETGVRSYLKKTSGRVRAGTGNQDQLLPPKQSFLGRVRAGPRRQDQLVPQKTFLGRSQAGPK